MEPISELNQPGVYFFVRHYFMNWFNFLNRPVVPKPSTTNFPCFPNPIIDLRPFSKASHPGSEFTSQRFLKSPPKFPDIRKRCQMPEIKSSSQKHPLL